MATYIVTNTFTTDTTAVASQVNQNFTDVLTALNAFDASNLSSGTVPLARISGLTVTQIAAATIVLEAEGIGNNDNDTTWPTSAAVRDYVDALVGSSYRLISVNGSAVKVYTKYLTGTLNGNNSENIAHGVTSGLTKILSVTVHAYNDGVGYQNYKVNEHRMAEAAATIGLEVGYDDTNIEFTNKGSNIVSNNYRIKIDYIL